MTILVTGAAGFIGMHVADRLMAQGHAVAAALALHLCFLLCAVAAGAIAWATPSWSSSRLPD